MTRRKRHQRQVEMYVITSPVNSKQSKDEISQVNNLHLISMV